MHQNSINQDRRIYRREVWLKEQGRTEADVMVEHRGEFIIIDGEDGFEKLFLPVCIWLL